jgi:hypothetical protein
MISQQGQLNEYWCRIQGSRRVAVIAGLENYRTVGVNPVSDIQSLLTLLYALFLFFDHFLNCFLMKIRLAVWS